MLDETYYIHKHVIFLPFFLQKVLSRIGVPVMKINQFVLRISDKKVANAIHIKM